jgi:hypothetical protein
MHKYFIEKLISISIKFKTILQEDSVKDVNELLYVTPEALYNYDKFYVRNY